MKPHNRLSPLLLITLLFLAGSQIAWTDGSNGMSSVKPVLRVTEGQRSPLRLAIDDQDVVYVTDGAGGRVCKYDSAGSFLGEFPAGSFSLAIAVTPQRLLYVGDKASGAFRILDVDGNLIATGSNDLANFELPSCAIIDDDNRLVVVDGKKKCVRIFDATGHQVASFGDKVLVFPTGITFDRKNQRFLVAEHGGLTAGSDSAKTMIHVFDKKGRWLAGFGDYGHQPGQFTRIQGISVDRSGQVYVTDSYQGTVTVLSETGAVVTTVGRFGTEPGEMRAPMDVAIDSRDRLWVASMNNASLEVYDISSLMTAVEAGPVSAIPAQSELLQNYPNPFNPGTSIPFRLATDSHVAIRIYNEMGQLVRSFDLGKRRRGSYTSEGNALYWDGTNGRGEPVASRVYLYEIRAGDYIAVRRMLFLK